MAVTWGTLFFSLRWWRERRFSPERVESMIMTTSRWRDRTDDWCKYKILGDPRDVGQRYVKINFWCDGENYNARSTLALDAINGRKFGDILAEYARIVGIDPDLIEKQGWRCLVNDREINNFETEIPDAGVIDCYDK